LHLPAGDREISHEDQRLEQQNLSRPGLVGEVGSPRERQQKRSRRKDKEQKEGEQKKARALSGTKSALRPKWFDDPKNRWRENAAGKQTALLEKLRRGQTWNSGLSVNPPIFVLR
jgi:hypothetical protein